MIRICVAGVTGWVGRALVPAIAAADDLELVGAVSRSAAGQTVSAVLDVPDADIRISATVHDALTAPVDILVDYTSASVVKTHVLDALAAGVSVVVGTSGLSGSDYDEIDAAASSAGLGVIAAGNFAISAVLMQHFAVIAARYLPTWEVLDYASGDKKDAPSGTARELAFRLGRAAGASSLSVPIDSTQGSPGARGLTLDGTQVHSIRMPGIVIGAEVILGRASELLSIRYDGGSDADPYVGGTLMACRKVGNTVGLTRGLDRLLDL